ncbi:hypothetical protein FDUTEX481_07682 [Tolypothrix sp. PCC 7601]|nr:hypothetical protein FDUTEX481_07682 [Tolypothrix sp. PCC 7601]
MKRVLASFNIGFVMVAARAGRSRLYCLGIEILVKYPTSCLY